MTRMIRKAVLGCGAVPKRLANISYALLALAVLASPAMAQDPVYELPDIGFDGPEIVTAYGAQLGDLLVILVGLGLVIFGAWRVLRWTRRATA